MRNRVVVSKRPRRGTKRAPPKRNTRKPASKRPRPTKQKRSSGTKRQTKKRQSPVKVIGLAPVPKYLVGSMWDTPSRGRLEKAKIATGNRRPKLRKINLSRAKPVARKLNFRAVTL
jgi:hypothetical protein